MDKSTKTDFPIKINKSTQTDFEDFPVKINKSTQPDLSSFTTPSRKNKYIDLNVTSSIEELPLKKKRKRCSGCFPNFQQNQIAHMDEGGCLYSPINP